MKARISERLLQEGRGPASPVEVYDTIDAGFVARLRPSGHIAFWIYLDRGRRKLKIGDWPQWSVKEARERFRQERDRILEQGNPHRLTFDAFLDEVCVPTYSLDHSSLKHLDTLKPFRKLFGDELLSDITETQVDEWRAQRRREGIKAATINRNISALKAVFNFAERKGYLVQSPLRGLKRLRVEQEHRIRWLRDDEEKRLRKALLEREQVLRDERASANRWRERRGYELLPDLSNYQFADHVRPMVLLSLNTGLRQGELFSLTWDRVEGGFITVNATNSKSRRSRHVPLNREAADTLEGWSQQVEPVGLVFQGRDGRFDNVRKAWGRLLREAEIHDFTWHDMRHHFASRLVMKGVPLNTVRELLGHADLQTTMRYAHLAPQHLREAVEALDG